MIQLTSHRDVAIYTDTLCSLAIAARAERNVAALEFVGRHLKGIMPDAALDAFRDYLKTIPARPVENHPVAVQEPAKDLVAEVDAYRAKRDVVRKAVESTLPAIQKTETANLDF